MGFFTVQKLIEGREKQKNTNTSVRMAGFQVGDMERPAYCVGMPTIPQYAVLSGN